jgi:hypothetical protein
VVTFRLRVAPSPDDAAAVGCTIPVVVLGDVNLSLAKGSSVEIEGALAERRWKGPGGIRQSHFEILARMARVL